MTSIVVEDLTQTDEPPSAGVTVTGLEAGDQEVTIQVSWDEGASWRTVAGGGRQTVVGGVFVRDHFPPLNVAATWRVIEHSVSGEPATVSDPLTITTDRMWLQDPLDPRSAVTVGCEEVPDENRWLMVGSFAQAAWSQSVDLAQVLGDDRPIASVGQRMIAGQVPLTIEYDVAAEGGLLRRMLLRAGQLVLRGHHVDLLEPVAYIVIPDAREGRDIEFTSPPHQVSTWDVAVTQVRPLNLRFVVPWFTYDQVRTAWDGLTYDDVDSARPGETYLDWARDPLP